MSVPPPIVALRDAILAVLREAGRPVTADHLTDRLPDRRRIIRSPQPGQLCVGGHAVIHANPSARLHDCRHNGAEHEVSFPWYPSLLHPHLLALTHAGRITRSKHPSSPLPCWSYVPHDGLEAAAWDELVAQLADMPAAGDAT